MAAVVDLQPGLNDNAGLYERVLFWILAGSSKSTQNLSSQPMSALLCPSPCRCFTSCFPELRKLPSCCIFTMILNNSNYAVKHATDDFKHKQQLYLTCALFWSSHVQYSDEERACARGKTNISRKLANPHRALRTTRQSNTRTTTLIFRVLRGRKESFTRFLSQCRSF